MGSGSDVLAALLEGYDVVGVDYSTTMFDAARARVEAFCANQQPLSAKMMALDSKHDVSHNDYLQAGSSLAAEERMQAQADDAARLQLVTQAGSKVSSLYDSEVDRLAGLLYMR